MYLNEKHGLNKNVLDYIIRVKRQRNDPLIAAPDSAADAYMGQGSHPDVVWRVWDVINRSLPKDCRCLLYGTPSLVHPHSGIILAFCNGTQYCIRLADKHLDEAIKAGVRTRTKWAGGSEMDTQLELGPNWVFGNWSDSEIEWCRTVYFEFENQTT
jgi:hypothetical protein